MSDAARLPASRLLPRDVLGVGSIGLRTRRLRAALSAVGVAIGIASMVAVLGISASSQADLLNTIDRLGTNLLTMQAGQSFFGEATKVPRTAPVKLGFMPGVRNVTATYAVDGASVRRNELVDENDTSGIAVLAADLNLPATLSAGMASGRFFTSAQARYPTVVLGQIAATRLGIASVQGSPQVYIGDTYYTVVGILSTVTLDSAIDRAALIGLPVAARLLGTESNPSKVYLRADDSALTGVRELIPATANPEHPEEVEVSRPSDALEAKAAAKGAFTSLLLGLGAVALLVGGVGIANVMVISVLERRSEIGLRRALGATRRHISAQFLTESLLLAAIGGIAGAALGAIVTAAYAGSQGQAVVVPPQAVGGGIAAALLIGVVAGLYPSMRAARLSPTEALRSA
ncbi:MAG: putative transport system permease protein [Solirubrobacteraceae bacterium]|jgi:putative ABC transport system permease protein|nr:putative transport system permease protein [Solirubrobacteraceae bacterium]